MVRDRRFIAAVLYGISACAYGWYAAHRLVWLAVDFSMCLALSGSAFCSALLFWIVLSDQPSADGR